ncbi:hypothetical protein MUP77_06980 [Candidatus Bathyarchaeota archaeon]|nr:hypothetical protein [Candidatus Bathyarchaeota archaeon]
MNKEQREDLKKRTLIFAADPNRPTMTIQEVASEFDIEYTTALGILFELGMEGYLVMKRRSTWRLFSLNREKMLPPKRAVLLKEI